ncbi:MAG: DUF3035 domain-containing protein [Paracoccaceae bacterium]
MRTASLLIILSTLTLSACGEPKLRELRNPGEGPDEFIVSPPLPLQEPESYSSLPQPTPGGANIADPRPLDDVATSLGGQRTSPTGPVPGADAGIVNYASRNGVAPDIRTQLAEEDAAFRRRQGRFANIKLFPVDRYADAYRRQAINPEAVARVYRRAGIVTPSAPPASR